MSDEMLDSKQFNEKLELLQEALNKRLDESAKDRHVSNNNVHRALNTLAQQTDNQDGVLANLSAAVKDIAASQKLVADSVRRIEVRMVGDAALASTGLIQEQAELKARTAANEVRMKTIEDSLETDRKEYLSDKRFIYGMIVAITAIGGIVTFLQSTGTLHFLTPKA